MIKTHLIKERGYAVQRSPTLNTVLMIEKTIKNLNEVITVSKLKKILPKQVMHQTLMVVLDYLEYSGKIVFHDNRILWTFKPKSKLKKEKGLRVR